MEERAPMRSGSDPQGGAEGTQAIRGDGWLTLCVSLASAVLVLALASPMLSGRIYGGDDLTAFHLPIRWFYWNALQGGHAFDWMPDILCGFYLTGEGQGATYHPVHLALYRWLPFRTAFNLEVWLSYPAMFAGMLLWLRRGPFVPPAWRASPAAAGDGEPEGLPLHAALFGAMLFTFSSSCLLHIVHMNAVAVLAHLPWQLWAIDVAVRSPRKRSRTLALAAVAMLTASSVLCGHPQYTWICAIGELLWLAVLLATADGRIAGLSNVRETSKSLAGLAAAKLLGGALGAIQLLPSLDHLLGSQRHEAAIDVTSTGSLHPINVVQFLAPFLLRARAEGGNTHEYGLYAGVVPVVLCLWLISQRASLGRAARPLLAMTVFAAVAFVLSLGSYGGLYQAMTLLPGVGEFRFAARYVVLVHLAIAVLASVAFARLSAGAGTDHGGWSNGWKLAAFSAAIAIELRLLLPPERLGTVLGASLGPLFFVVGIAAFTWALRGGRVAVPLLVVLAAADAGFYGFSYMALAGARTMESVVDSVPALVSKDVRLATLQPDEEGVFSGNHWILRGWRLSDGYVGLLPANRLEARTLAGMRMANVGFVLRQGEAVSAIDGLTVVDARLHGVPEPLPRVRIATRAVVSASPASDAARLPPTSLVTTAFTDAPLALEGPAGRVAMASDSPGAIELEVSVPATQLVVVTERYHAGWRARIDGSPREVRRVDGDFMGVVVEAGESKVSLAFEPDSLRYGKTVSTAALTIWGLLLATALVRSRQDDAAATGQPPAAVNAGKGRRDASTGELRGSGGGTEA